MSEPLRELRYAVRSLFRQPAFTVIAVGTIALGIGAKSRGLPRVFESRTEESALGRGVMPRRALHSTPSPAFKPGLARFESRAEESALGRGVGARLQTCRLVLTRPRGPGGWEETWRRRLYLLWRKGVLWNG